MTETLWDFAIARYRLDGVAACCLQLQDNAGADVNMLLAAAWLSDQGYHWQHGQVRELIAGCEDWRAHCILPLRAVRRYLNEQTLKGQAMSSLYEQAKKLEIDAEIHQLHLLHTALQSMTFKTRETANALSDNLQIYFDCLPNLQAIAHVDRHTLVKALRGHSPY